MPNPSIAFGELVAGFAFVQAEIAGVLSGGQAHTAIVAPNPSIERTVTGKPVPAAHVERYAPA
jgi:hypothetical protein